METSEPPVAATGQIAEILKYRKEISIFDRFGLQIPESFASGSVSKLFGFDQFSSGFKADFGGLFLLAGLQTIIDDLNCQVVRSFSLATNV